MEQKAWIPFLISMLSCGLSIHVKVKLDGKIVGGESVKLDRFPSAVQFLNRGGMCAGTILNSWTVLTAAHCFDVNKNINDMIVQVGARYLFDRYAVVHEVYKFIVHEGYNKETLFACDVALIFLELPIHFTSRSKKAILVNNGSWMNNEETNFIATGWGWTEYGGPISEKGLMMTQLKYVSAQECGALHQIKLTADMFCLYGGGLKDTCKGDSGGSVMWRDMVVGITSHGDGCAKKDKPSVYSNVWYFRRWIYTNIMNFFTENC